MKHPIALFGTSPLRFLSRLSVVAATTLLAGVATTLPAHAGLEGFHRVFDMVNNRGASSGSNLSPFDWIQSEPAPADATGVTFFWSAFDQPGAPGETDLYTDHRDNNSITIPVAQMYAGYLPLGSEVASSSSWSFPADNTGKRIVLRVSTNTLGNTQSNEFITWRENRVRYGTTAANWPTECSCPNVVEGETYLNGLPTFQGYATPRNYPSHSIGQVFLSLEKNIDGTFWDGGKWGNRRVKIGTVLGTPNSSTGRVAWSKYTQWPSGKTDLPNGDYTLRIMALHEEPIVAGPEGLQNTITFKIRHPVIPPKSNSASGSE